MKQDLTVHIEEIDLPGLDNVQARLNKILEMSRYAKNPSTLNAEFNHLESMANFTKKKIVKIIVSLGRVTRSFIVIDPENLEKHVEYCKLEFLNKFGHYRRDQKMLKQKLCHTPQTGYPYTKSGDVLTSPETFYNISCDIARDHVRRPKHPTTEDRHIGIEIEMVSPFDIDHLVRLIAQKKWHKHMRVMTDRSVEPHSNCPFTMELCVLMNENTYQETFKQIQELLELMKAEVNDTCGFHVHLDARKRNVRLMYHNLVNAQALLFKIAHPLRQSNRYCRHVFSPDWDAADGNHYNAISRISYEKHRTIEIRIHEGTVDPNEMKNWIKLLLKIANYDKPLLMEEVETILDEGDKLYVKSKAG